MGGIAAARGRFVIMGDADDSYDFGELPTFVERAARGLRSGAGLPARRRAAAQSCPGRCRRCIAGSGNPMFSRMARRWFRAPIHDVYCGLRGFTKELYDRLDLRCTGMEFATEMIIKASLAGARIAEVPITLHPDGRAIAPAAPEDVPRRLADAAVLPDVHARAGSSSCPGCCSMLLGLAGYAVAMPRCTIGAASPSTRTRCSSPAWRSSAATRPSSSRSSRRPSP